jgi:D-inositol-3-phosphate glycosyltransferase
MRLLVVTARFPTRDRPAAGAFVRDRLADPEVESVVIAPHDYAGSPTTRYLSLLWRALRARGPFDGVEGHFVLPSGVLALLVARVRRLPLVVYAHGSDVRELAHRNPLLGWLARRVVRGADVVLTNSIDTARHVEALGARARIAPPGIELARFTPSPPPRQGRVLYLGGAARSKGVEIARRLADTLVGPGLNEVDPSEVPTLLAAHDILLMPSLGEGFGLAAAEAIAAGRWVVASASGGLRGTIDEGVNGTLVADGDYAGALTRVPEYDPFALAVTAERFSLARWQQQFADVWQEVLGRPGRVSTRTPNRP